MQIFAKLTLFDLAQVIVIEKKKTLISVGGHERLAES